MPRYPNPDDVVRPTWYPPKYPLQLTSNDAAKLYPIHNHNAAVDAQGNGVTSTDASHYHRVRAGQVLPDSSDGHTHRLTGLPAGAG